MKAKLLIVSVALALVQTVRSQAVGKCTRNGHLLPDESNCQVYYACVDGQHHLIKCENDLKFDYRLKTCTGKSHAQCYDLEKSLPVCPQSGNILLPNPDDCGTFYQCDHGVPVLQHCPPGLHFNAELGLCDIPENAHCQASTTTSEATESPTETTVTTEQATKTTTEGETSPPYTEGTTTTTEQETTGTTVNPTEEPTNGPTEGPTSEPTEEPTNTPTPTDEPTETTSSDSPTNPPFEPDCPANGKTTIPNPYDCGSFYVCINGFGALIDCPAGLHFNPDKEICQTPEEAHCQLGSSSSQPTEPTNPTETTTETGSEEPTTGTTEPSEEPTTGTTEPSEEPTVTTTEGSTATNEPTDTTTESTGPTTSPPYKPDCPATGTTTLPNPVDCGSFYVCIEGLFALISCPAGFHFNAQKGECQVPSEAHCELTTTSEPGHTPTVTTTEQEDTTTEDNQTTEPDSTTDDNQTEPGITSTTENDDNSSTGTDSPTTTDSGSEIPTDATQTTTEQGSTSGGFEPDCPAEGKYTIPNPEDCNSFYVCINGYAALVHCPSGLHFDAETETCTDPASAHCELQTTTSKPFEPNCPVHGSALVSNPEDCGSFFVCIDGNHILLQCPNGFFFDSSVQNCVQDHSVCEAVKRNFESEPPKECSEEGELLPNPDDCATFYICSGGKPILTTCPPGLYYNELAQACDFPQNSPCYTSTFPPDTTTTTSIWETTTTSQSEGTTPPNGHHPNCPPTGTSILPNPDDCGSYFVCINGDYALVECPDGYQYNDNVKQCVPSDGTCNAGTTEPTSTTTSEGTTPPNGHPPNCPPTGTSVLPNPDDCTSYYVCVNGDYALIECPDGYQFSNDVKQCVPSDGTCNDGTTGSPTTETTAKPTEGPTTDTTTTESGGTCHSSVPEPNPGDCSSYIICDNGNPTVLPCPPGTEFSPDDLVCENPDDANCPYAHENSRFVNYPVKYKFNIFNRL